MRPQSQSYNHYQAFNVSHSSQTLDNDRMIETVIAFMLRMNELPICTELFYRSLGDDSQRRD